MMNARRDGLVRTNALRLLALLAVAATACGGAAGKAVQPKDFTGAAAVGGTPVSCDGSPKLMQPLIVDLDPDARASLETSMKKGLVVVSYDCKALRVLPTCHLTKEEIVKTDYAFAGASRKEQIIQLKSQDDLNVNLPLSAGKLGGNVSSGRSLDLALIRIGLRSTSIDSVASADLKGSCEGATHFVQSASLGAFAMSTGSAGKVAAVGELFKVGASASSSSSRNASNTDGSLESCRTSDPDADKPPAECRSPLSVLLLPLAKADPSAAKAKADDAEEKKAPKAEKILNPCPPGYQFSGGMCTKAPEVAHLCMPEDTEDCKAQCAKGSAESCANVAPALVLTDGDIPYLKKACDLGHFDSCAVYANRNWNVPGQRDPNDKANLESKAYARKGCEGGSANSCYAYGDLLTSTPVTEDRDYVHAAKALDKGCSLGNARACADLGTSYELGTGVSKDLDRALSLNERACAGKEFLGCLNAGELLLKKSEPDEVERGVRMLKTLCAGDEGTIGCSMVARSLREGSKFEEAFAISSKLCSKDVIYCDDVANAYATGNGVAKDPKKARELYKKACDKGNGSRAACKVMKIKMKR